MKLHTKFIGRKEQNGFTLIELLVVIGILAILLAITLIAINPNKHFQDTRNTQRSSNVSEILNAIYEYESANNGNEPASVANLTSTPTPLASVTVPADQTDTTGGATFATNVVTFNLDATNNILTATGNVTVSGCTGGASVDNGTYPVEAITSTTLAVTNASGAADGPPGTCTIGSWTGVNDVDLCADVVPTFLAAMPVDPKTGSGTCSGSYATGYTISASNGRFTIAAPSAEDGATISVTR